MEKKITKKKRGRSKNIRSREASREKEKIENIIKNKNQSEEKKIKIPVFDNPKSSSSVTIEEFIDNKKKELNKNKISLEHYIHKVDVDNDNIFKHLDSILSNDVNNFFELYKDELYKLNFEQRIKLQKKFEMNKDIPEIIQKNSIRDEQTIEKIFNNILLSILEMKEGNIKKFDDIFIDNNVFFKNELDLIIPYKYGTKELQYYCLLSDLFFFFHESDMEFELKLDIYIQLSEFIRRIKDIGSDLITKCNYLINILYMYLENKDIDLNMLLPIVQSCLPFDKEIAKDTFKILKITDLGNQVIFLINDIPIKNYEGEIKGDEKITLEYKVKKVKIEVLSRDINWYLKDGFLTKLKSEDFTLCVCYPKNSEYNIFTLDGIKEDVNNFFHKIIHSKPMKQAMIIDKEACNFKYLFDNEDILNEFKKNIHLAPLPFNNYDGYTDKKSFDIYINVSYKTNNEFPKILKKYNCFFISKAHELKHGSRIYLRIYNNNIKIRTPIKYVKKYKGERAYLTNIFNNTQNILNDIYKINSPKPNKNISVKEYGELLELSLFGYKCDNLIFRSIIYVLSDSSWDLNPEDFYNNFTKSLLNTEQEDLEKLCNEPFLNKLLSFFDKSKKEKKYGNFLISKDSNIISGDNINYFIFERTPHYGIREVNRGKNVNELLSVKQIKELIEKETKNEEFYDDDDEEMEKDEAEEK